MKILKNHCLKQYNSFGLKCKADFFVEVYSLSDIEKIYAHKEFQFIPKLILGGGSNILLCEVFNGLVIKMNLTGINHCGNGIIKVAAGENWHEFVLWTLDQGFGGLENLAKLTIFLTDLNDFAVVNKIMATYFSEPYPARATIEVSALPKGVTVEIEAIMAL